jgi:hypothetical protein
LLFVAAVASGPAVAAPARAQAPQRASLLQLEIGDSIGLPLPDARMEVYTLLEGGIVWEWAPVQAEMLPPGISLLRFSNPGYRHSVFSVPLREGSRVSLRVRLRPARDSQPRNREIVAEQVGAIGMSIEGRVKNDIIGSRRVLDRAAIERADASSMGDLMRRARGTDLTILPGPGGAYDVRGRSTGGGSGCQVPVMINGDRRRIMSFATFDRMFGTSEAEAIEVLSRTAGVPFAYRAGPGCGLLVVWFKNP